MITQAFLLLCFLFFFFCAGSHYVAQTGLELMVRMPQPFEGWDYSAHE